jgi:LacI family transcriptional regulator
MVQQTGRRGERTATIADVAAEAGFSAMTVSRVVNGTHVSAKAEATVLAAIAKLGYEPNAAARALAGSGPIRIGLPFDNPSAAYLSEFLLGALDHAQKVHSQLIVVKCELHHNEDEAIRSLLDSKVDGILLPPPLSDSAMIRAIMMQSDTPTVAVAGGAHMGEASSVRIDDFLAASAMTKYVVGLGHRRIGFIQGNLNQMITARREAGYRAALAEAGLSQDTNLIVSGDFTYRSGLEAAEKLLDLPDPPTAIFASNDDMAAATISTAHRRHLNVPADLTVCGFDDTISARSIWPELTTIHQPIGEMAGAAVALLVSAIHASRRGEHLPPSEIILDHLLLRRGSDGPPRSEREQREE